MKKIVVGIDLSDTSELALGHAVEAARRIGAEVVMVMVDVVPEMPAVIDPGTLPIARNYHQELAARLAADHRALAALRERWNGRGAELSMLMVDGYADERLTAVAAEVNAELIVVGSHGRTGARRFLLGSVPNKISHHAPCSVYIARTT